MYNNISASNICLPFLLLEPFTKREALSWLIEQAGNAVQDNQLKISIRALAKIWNWHKSKVERFIKLLKKEAIIETVTEIGKTSLIHCKTRVQGSCKSITETVIGTVVKATCQETTKQDSIKTSLDRFEDKQTPTIDPIPFNGINTVSGQERDTLVEKKKKEKKQKKKEERNLKEKSSLLERAKKEKVFEPIAVDFSPTEMEEIKDFASSIAIEPESVESELAKFKDHLSAGYRRPPKYALPAFRNWLRRSIEFNRFRRRYEQNSQTRPTSFETFLTAAARTLAERKKRRLGGLYARESTFGSESASDKQGFSNLQTVN